MNHKPFENWILDESQLSADQKKEMARHLSACPHCRRLDSGWQASKRLMRHAVEKTPAPGFTQRWHVYAQRKRDMIKVRRYRLGMASLLFLAFIASLTYMIASGSIMQMLADVFNGITNIVIGITSGLSALGYWLYRLPIAVPLTLGFIFLGLINAFVFVALFAAWNLKQRKLQTDEVRVE